MLRDQMLPDQYQRWLGRFCSSKELVRRRTRPTWLRGQRRVGPARPRRRLLGQQSCR